MSSRHDPTREADDDDESRPRWYPRGDGCVATIPYRRCARVWVLTDEERARWDGSRARTGATRGMDSRIHVGDSASRWWTRGGRETRGRM